MNKRWNIKSFFGLLITICLVTLMQVDVSYAYKTSGDYRYDVLDDGTVSLVGYIGDDTDVVVPSTIDGYTVSSVDCFLYSDLKTVTIPATVKRIEEKGFYNSESLEKVTFLGESLEYIGKEAFQGCALKTIEIPSSVTTVEEYAFAQNDLTAVTVPNTVKVWGKAAYIGCRKLTSVVFEEGCTAVEPYMFSSCSELKNVKLASTIKTIGEAAFSHGGTITEMTFPTGLETISENAFYATTIEKLIVNCDDVKLEQSAMYMCSVMELYCTKQSTIYEKYKGSYTTKIILTGTYMEDEEVTLKFGQTYQLVITNPSGTTTWSSSDASIATVSETGLVTGVGTGSAVITAMNNGVTMQCTVTVGKFKLNKTKATLGAGATVTLKVTDGVKVEWKSSNTQIATVNAKGVVTTKKKGKVKITATAVGTTLTCDINVKPNERKNLEKYPKKASAYPKNIAAFGFTKIKRDSKGNYIINGHFLNNYSETGTYLKNLTITVYKDGKKIAKQKYSRFKIKAPANSIRPVTIKIKKSKITKKTTDLRNGKITIKVGGGTLYR